MVLADIGKFVGAKVAGTLIVLAIGAGAYWCYQHPDAVKASAVIVERVLVWTVVAAILPWTSYVYMRPLLSMQAGTATARSALAIGVLLIAGYSLLDVVLALWLARWSIHGTFTWFVVLLGFAAAAAYNWVICESLARHVES